MSRLLTITPVKTHSSSRYSTSSNTPKLALNSFLGFSNRRLRFSSAFCSAALFAVLKPAAVSDSVRASSSRRTAEPRRSIWTAEMR